MLRTTTLRRVRIAAVAGVLGAGLVAVPPAAFADDDHHRRGGWHDRDRDHRRGDWERHRGREYRHGDWKRHRDSNRDRVRRHVRAHRHDRHCRHDDRRRADRRRDGWAYRRPPARVWYGPPHRTPPRYAVPVQVHGRHWCAQCNRWWNEQSQFYGHLGSYHRVPRASLADVIASAVFGSIYYGY